MRTKLRTTRIITQAILGPKFWLLVLPTFLIYTLEVKAVPALGAHVLAYHSCGGSGGLSTQPVTTQTSGSTILIWVGRGDLSQFTQANIPNDNKGNTYSLIGEVHTYAPLWPSSGEALYACTSATGGTNHIFSAPMSSSDEITLAAVEITNGGVIEDAEWNVVTNPPQTSLDVTTTGSATLVAIWCGDSGANLVTAIPDNGFTTTDSQLLAGCQVEVVVATKDVIEAGTYHVTWTATPVQGTHMYLVAVKSTPPPVLELQVSGESQAVYWPTSAAGYGLETTSNLTLSSAWHPVTNVPETVGPLNMITGALQTGPEFYRLKKP